MKKFLRIISCISLLTISSLCLISCRKESESLTKVRLNEVARSIFYAPMYIAINEGFFEEEGLEIDLSTGNGADKTMQQVLSNNADIGFSGPEQAVYINNQGREDYPVVFAQLTQTDGAFLVSREVNEDFKWEDLRGKELIGGRPGGVPEMAFEYALKKNGLDPKKDVNLVTNIDFAATSGAFKGGIGEYVALFEPTASMLEKEGSGTIVASVGAEVGYLPYTCFFSTKSYIDENPEIIQSFTNAIYKGQIWFDTHTNEEVADSIISFFPGTDKDLIISVIENYREIDALAINPIIEEEELTRLLDIIEGYDAKLLTERPSFEKIIDNTFAEEAINNIK